MSRSHRIPRQLPLALVVLSVLHCAPAEAPTGASSGGSDLPTRFVAGRIFVRAPVAGTADSLLLYTDTGGGLFLLGRAADRLALGDSSAVSLAALTGESVPDPLGAPDHRVPIYRPERDPGVGYDGMLGQSWFADRTWTLDYVAETLTLRSGAGRAETDGTPVPLAFRDDSTGARSLSFPRVRMAAGGDSLDMLLDTGATAVLTDSSRAQLGAGPAERATSFITTSVLERWSDAHPGWRVIPSADGTLAGMRMIEVPRVEIAGVPVGPVWFTERPDSNFHDYMAQWMDRPLDGAIGGNALRFFVVTLDYPAATAFFRPANP